VPYNECRKISFKKPDNTAAAETAYHHYYLHSYQYEVVINNLPQQ